MARFVAPRASVPLARGAFDEGSALPTWAVLGQSKPRLLAEEADTVAGREVVTIMEWLAAQSR